VIALSTNDSVRQSALKYGAIAALESDKFSCNRTVLVKGRAMAGKDRKLLVIEDDRR